MKNSGYSFIGRYYGNYQLTAQEARRITEADLSIVTLWESGSPTFSSYFSDRKGYSDGETALNYGKNYIAQPSGTPIYFAVDYDASDSDISGVILQYFNGVQDAFSDLGNRYSIGVYGSGAVCDYIYRNVPKVYYKMLAAANSWRGSRTYSSWNIKQGSTVTISGVTFDSDLANNPGAFILTDSDTVVQIDTTMDVTKRNGETYIFKTTSVETPIVTVGTNGVVSLTHLKREGGSDYWHLLYTGNPGQAAGIYTAGPYEKPLKRFVARVM
ncbi:MAG: hypothetical protein ACFWTN_11900 [Clostridium sp.]